MTVGHILEIYSIVGYSVAIYSIMTVGHTLEIYSIVGHSVAIYSIMTMWVIL